MSEEKKLELETLERQCAHLRAAAESKQRTIWSMGYSETRKFQESVLVPLEQKEQELRILKGRIKAAETRRRNAEEKRRENAAK